MSTKINFEHEAQVKEETYSFGDWFSTDQGLMRLVGANNNDIACLEMVLEKNPNNGVFWNMGIRVDNKFNITKTELEIIKGSLKFITRVSVEITTKPYQP